MVKKKDIIAIVGPTATGKSNLAMMLAKNLDGEIISADSRQVYKEFDIATAKPSLVQMGGIKHYLIDLLEPFEDFSAGLFVDLAREAIEEISSNGKLPIIVGGTGLYFKMLLENYKVPKGEPNLRLRNELEELAQNEGVEAVYAILLKLDKKCAEKIHPNNLHKVIRAIEILNTHNKSMEEARGKSESDYNVKWIGLDAIDRQFLYDKINKRVDEMVEAGVEQEARRIVDKYGCTKLVENTIGYQEFLSYFNGKISINEAVEKIKQNTRRYAKRQLTWFRHQEGINWFYIDEMSVDKIFESVITL